jgi:uncharacterized protein YecE (DUF72 family)
VSPQRIEPTVGCCGFAAAQSKYFATFPCVEIDTSFYNLPRVETVARWRKAAPEEFQFALKAWQVITHPATSPTYRRTRIDPRDREHCGDFGFNPTVRWAWDETFAVAKTLGAFLVLFQCPPSFRATNENVGRLRAFFERAKRGKFYMGWEPRGAWNADLVAKLCRELDLIHVVDPFKSEPAVTGKIRYFRLHGVTGARHRFSREELNKLNVVATGKPPSYCLFNNVSMWDDARRFAAML